MKKILLGLLVLMTTFVSCTDQEEIEIIYQSEMGITAAHIFDDYEPYDDKKDFVMSIGGWKLNLLVLVYDESGKLVDKAEKLCNSLSESLNYAPYLAPGNYTVISIADFRNGLGGNGYKFWNIENESNIQDLSITENKTVYPVVFETLGLDIQKISITNKSTIINADIKPITALVHIYENNNDHIGAGIDGYSRFVPVCAGYFIRSNKCKNKVKVENGTFSAQYTEQTSDYNLAISEVANDWLNNKNPLQHSYRALLPDNNCVFKWHIQKSDLKEDDIFNKYSGEIKTDGESNQKIDLIQGKQYVLSMILDCLSLDVFEYPEKFKAEEYAQKQVDEFCKKSIDEFLSYNFESILEKDENHANTFLGENPESHYWSGELYLADYSRPGIERFEIERTVGYLNTKVDCAVIVQFLLPNLSDDVLQHIRKGLTDKYRVDQEYTSPDNYCFLNPDTSVDSHYRIVLQKKKIEEKTYYFLSYILRDAYQPDNNDEKENLWADFTTLFGADKNTVKSTVEGWGCSYSFSDNSGSVNGSDYYYIENNDYADIIGFVFNPDNQVSQYWVYYKPDKVNEVYSYLTKKYTAVESENTEYVYVFYNGGKDLKVVLDLMNGAVVYTKLDMKQHVTPA